MPTNANTFNSRVTSEALEAKFRQVFPAQGGAELVQDLFASGVIQPVVDFSTVAEGSILPENLQTAWDFSTGSLQVTNGSSTLISNTGFWKVGVTATLGDNGTAVRSGVLRINDGATNKNIWGISTDNSTAEGYPTSQATEIVVFLRSGDSLQCACSAGALFDVAWRQIADVNGTLVNPLGFTFS